MVTLLCRLIVLLFMDILSLFVLNLEGFVFDQ
jgi:hypothetical protein